MRDHSRRRGGALAAILWTLAVLVVIALGAAYYVGSRWLPNVQVTRSPDGKIVEVETPGGSIRVEPKAGLTPRHFGVPLYPGATPVEGKEKSAAVQIDIQGVSKDVAVSKAEYETTDSLDQVKAFYREELPHWLVTGDSFEFHEGGHRRVIALRRAGTGTRILLASAGEPGAN
ncbi:MAG: hypothetical protein IPM24_27255 [Bryobacterales bacterium]|jgi:hypothetical protein|nr:hypothetical protein [Bryobacterales bacterium]